MLATNSIRKSNYFPPFSENLLIGTCVVTIICSNVTLLHSMVLYHTYYLTLLETTTLHTTKSKHEVDTSDMTKLNRAKQVSTHFELVSVL